MGPDVTNRLFPRGWLLKQNLECPELENFVDPAWFDATVVKYQFVQTVWGVFLDYVIGPCTSQNMYIPLGVPSKILESVWATRVKVSEHTGRPCPQQGVLQLWYS